MLKKVSDLIGAELDYAVAKCEGATNLRENPHRFDKRLIFRLAERTVFMNDFRFSTDWAQGGPIIERENIVLNPQYPSWATTMRHAVSAPNTLSLIYSGPTPLISAMRCYVASKLGATVEIPDEIGAKQ